MKAKGLLFRLIVVQVFIQACMTGMRMAAPLLALRQGMSAIEVGVLMALFALTQVFLSLPAGRFADRNTLQRPVAISIVFAAAGAIAASAWPSFPVLCVAALCAGGSTGGALIALQRYTGRMAANPTELKQVYSWLAIGPSFSNFVGPFAAGFLIDHSGFRVAFAFLAMLPIVSWFLVRRVPETRPAQAEPAAAGNHAWDLLADRGMRRLIAVNWILASCWDVHTFVVPLLGHERGFSASVIGTILGAFAVATTAIRVVLPIVAARIQEWVAVSGAMAVTAMLFAVYPLQVSPWTMGVCSVLLGFALGVVQPMIMSALHQITPDNRHGEALGLRMMSVNVSSVLMPMMFGSAGAAVGVAAVFWTVGTMVALGSRVAWNMQDRRK